MKKLRPFFFAFIACCLLSCSFSIPRPHVYHDNLKIVVVDHKIPVADTTIGELPLYLASADWWDLFWKMNSYRYAGITICYGDHQFVTQISPAVQDSAYAVETMEHEYIHQQQIMRYSCPVMVEKNQSAEGVALLEAEAYSRANHLSGDSLINVLMHYERISLISRDSLKIIIKDYMK